MKKACLIGLPLCLVLLPSTILACICSSLDPAYAFNEAKVVFIGRMLGGTQNFSVKDDDGTMSTIEAGEVRFSVEEIFKGSNAEELTIQVASFAGTSCGAYGLSRGERYIVYAYADPLDNKLLTTGVCTRTISATSEYAKEDLDFLRNLPPPGTGGEVHGSIWVNLRDSEQPAVMLSEVRVKIIGPDGQTVTVFTDKQGEFTAKQLRAGKYKVEPELPPNYTSRKKFEEVMIDDRGSVMVRFETYIDGRVMGRVVDNEGNNFDFIRLSLVGEGKKVTGSSTGEDGVFEIQGVPPGEYFLTLQMQNPGDPPKIKSYYYPGTFDREKAAMIRVGLGARVADLEFRLPAESLVRTIEGEVVWDDGAPAAEVNVYLLYPRSTTSNGSIIEFNPTGTRTDKEGRFRLEGFTRETYCIQARGVKANENVAKNSRSLKLSINQNVKNLKLTLSKAGGFRDCR